MIRANYAAALGALLFDVMAFVSLMAMWLLRDHSPGGYISPVVSIFAVVYLTVGCIKRIGSALNELSDKTLPEEEQMKILNILNRYYNSYSQFHSINSHKSGEYILTMIKNIEEIRRGIVMTRGTKIFRIIISILLVVTMLCSVFFAVVFCLYIAKEPYGIYVAGVSVTRSNEDDILGDGTVSYDANNDILVFDNATIESEDTVVYSKIDLHIQLIGENNFQWSIVISLSLYQKLLRFF